MKKLVLLICTLGVMLSCITITYAWPAYLSPEALAQMGVSIKFNGASIAVLICDPFDAYINGNECREVSYDALSDLRDKLVMQSFDVRLMKGYKSDYYYLAYYDRVSHEFKGCLGDFGLGSQCVFRALDPTVSSSHTIKEIAGTGIYWIDSTAVSSLEYHYVDSTRFDNISRTLHMNVRSQYISIVKESVLLSGTPAYILKYLYNGKWVGIVCDQYGPIYCTTIGGNPDPGDTGTGESGSGATFDDTDIINAIDSVFRAISSVDDSVSYVSTYLSRLNNNFLNFYNDFKVKFEMQGNDLSNIYSVLLAMYQSFYDRFSDLDLSYYNDAEIVINNGGSLDWSESDRGAINVEATDIGTLELIGFPNISGYVVEHSFGDDITVRRNDGTYFPSTWELSGGTVKMPAIVDGYSSITVIAPAGAVVTVAGNEHTMTDDAYSVNVEFGSYTIDLTYGDGDDAKTASYTVDVDGYNDYAVTFDYTPGGFVVSVSVLYTLATSRLFYITIDGTRYSASDFSENSTSFSVSEGTQIKFTFSYAGDAKTYVYLDGKSLGSVTSAGTTYTVTSNCSIVFSYDSSLKRFIWNITTADTPPIVGDFETPTVTITANPSTSTPVTIQSLMLSSGSSDWLAIDTQGNTYSFDPVSNLALNRSFVVHTYTADEVASLDNFPSGYWMVSWSGESKYITVKFEEYSKFFLWLNRFLINFRDTLYTKMEDITVTAAGDLVLNTKDYTAQLNEINTTLSNLSFSGEVNTDLTPVITSVDAIGLNVESLNANFNTNIGSLLDKLDIVIEGSSESLEERINVTIDASNEAYNVFYITGEDGETQSVTEFTGDLTSASGRLLSLLYRLVFADTLSGVDDDLDGFEDFFTSQGDDTATQSMESSYEEENVWLVS